MRILAVLACGGCCVETFEVVADRTRQPIASLVVDGATVSGPLETFEREVGFKTVLTGDQRYGLTVTSAVKGSHPATLEEPGDVSRDVMVEIDLSIDEVCMAPDQDDYGTGRCMRTFAGTIEITGDGVAGSWVLDQGAVVIEGTPDC